MATKGLFKGKDTASEERSEARALKGGKLSVGGYMRGERAEGNKPSRSTATAIKSGKLTPAQYARREKK